MHISYNITSKLCHISPAISLFIRKPQLKTNQRKVQSTADCQHSAKRLNRGNDQKWVLFTRTKQEAKCTAREFSTRVIFQRRLCYGVCRLHTAKVCANICVHIKNPKHWQPQQYSDTQKYILAECCFTST